MIKDDKIKPYNKLKIIFSKSHFYSRSYYKYIFSIYIWRSQLGI